jgi:hypothetical protein
LRVGVVMNTNDSGKEHRVRDRQRREMRQRDPTASRSDARSGERFRSSLSYREAVSFNSGRESERVYHRGIGVWEAGGGLSG